MVASRLKSMRGFKNVMFRRIQRIVRQELSNRGRRRNMTEADSGFLGGVNEGGTHRLPSVIADQTSVDVAVALALLVCINTVTGKEAEGPAEVVMRRELVCVPSRVKSDASANTPHVRAEQDL